MPIIPIIIDIELMREFLSYNSETGALHWKKRNRNRFTSDRICNSWNSQNAGKRADKVSSHQYMIVRVNGTELKAHRVIWAIVYGEQPNFIDHIDHNKVNNLLSNLRSIDWACNARNVSRAKPNKSGFVGVYQQRNGRYMTCIGSNPHVRLGVFDKIEDAIAARKEAERELGYHPNHGTYLEQENQP